MGIEYQIKRRCVSLKYGSKGRLKFKSVLQRQEIERYSDNKGELIKRIHRRKGNKGNTQLVVDYIVSNQGNVYITNIKCYNTFSENQEYDQLKHLITETIRETLRERKETNKMKSHILKEGVQYNKNTNSFVFDFEHDNETDIIKLEHIGKKIEAFGECFYYGYEFSDDVDSKIRSEFIKTVKFPGNFDNNTDLSKFIYNAVTYLDSQISLPSYNVIVIPQSISEINRKMISYVSRITENRYIEIEMIKDLPQKIEFDYVRFNKEVLERLDDNGKPRYTEKQKEQALSNIQKMMDNIHKLDYFSIARDVKKNKYRRYIQNYYKFPDEETKDVFMRITNTNVLVIDDIVTSGTTIFHLLKSLRCVNDNNKITIFSLIGKNNIGI